MRKSKINYRYTTNEEDKELVKKYLEGDTGAFTPLFHKYKNIFFHNAIKWFNYKGIEIEDMAMEFLARISSKIHLYKPEKSLFSTWITHSMKNFMIEYHLRVKNKPHKGLFIEDLGYTDKDGNRVADSIADERSLDEVERLSYKKLIKDMINSLSKEDAKIFQEHFVNGNSQHDTADILGLPRNTMWYRVKKIKNHLQKYKDLL